MLLHFVLLLCNSMNSKILSSTDPRNSQKFGTQRILIKRQCSVTRTIHSDKNCGWEKFFSHRHIQITNAGGNLFNCGDRGFKNHQIYHYKYDFFNINSIIQARENPYILLWNRRVFLHLYKNSLVSGRL